MHVQHYCTNQLAYKPTENFVILCLDNQHRLINGTAMSSSTIVENTVYPSGAVTATMSHKTRLVILVHNH